MRKDRKIYFSVHLPTSLIAFELICTQKFETQFSTIFIFTPQSRIVPRPREIFHFSHNLKGQRTLYPFVSISTLNENQIL